MPKKNLKKIYRDAWEEGIFLREFGGDNGFLTAAGSVKKLQRLEKKLGKEIDVYDLQLGDCMALGALPRQRSDARRILPERHQGLQGTLQDRLN